MDVRKLTRNEVRQILRASEDVRSQPPLEDGPAKFLSREDMVEALWQLFQTPAVYLALNNLRAGGRVTVTGEIGSLFGFESRLPDAQRRGPTRVARFTSTEQRPHGRTSTTCVAVIERRGRAGQAPLQVHSFYPAVSREEMERLHRVRSNPEIPSHLRS